MKCKIIGCDHEIRAREVCSTHYNRMIKNGGLQKLQRTFDGRCKDCEQVRVRIKTDRKKSKHSFHYVNEQGRLWNGHQCPDCKNPKLLVKINKKKVKQSVDEEFIYC